MSYQVLARKWRPRRFADLVGQTHVVRALSNALDNNRLHHAFLFTGTRGVGKTTIARILAKSLNCEQGVGAQPCGTCNTCAEVDAGRFVDLIEVDAASRTKVDDTRELLDNVQYAPTRGRYKVYLIDEVHMLSGHSFNALLKTLEEPPPHVKFLLATTDPQKLPVTVLSRCLQFNLKRLDADAIRAQLQKILAAENIAADDAALAQIARAADGSMRDALSLLDQAIAYGAGGVREAEVRDMLGSIDQHAIPRLLAALHALDASAVLAVMADIAEHHVDYDDVLRELLVQLHRIALAQAVPNAVNDPVAAEYAAKLVAEDVQLYYQIGLLGRRDLALAPDARTGVEMTLLRMLAFRPAETASAPAPASPAIPPAVAAGAAPGVAKTAPQTAGPSAKPGASRAHAEPQACQAQPASFGVREPVVAQRATAAPMNAEAKNTFYPAAGPAKAASPTPMSARAPAPASGPEAETSPTAPTPARTPPTADTWRDIIDALALHGLVRELALNSVFISASATRLEIGIDPAYAHFNTNERVATLQQALEKFYDRTIALDVRVLARGDAASTPAQQRRQEQAARQQAAVQAIAADPTVQALQENFNARVNPASIKAK